MIAKRKESGESGEGLYYRIIIRPKEEFVTFRFHDVGTADGELIRLSGQSAIGTWDTHAWLISKTSAHMENGNLVPDSRDIERLFDKLGSKPVHVKGDIFEMPGTSKISEQFRWYGALGGTTSHHSEKKAQAHRKIS